MPRSFPRLSLATLAAGFLLVTIFAGLVVRLRQKDRDFYDNTILQRDAAVLFPVAEQELEESAQAEADSTADPNTVLEPVLLKSAKQANMIGVAIFNAKGETIQATETLRLPELSPVDFAELQSGEPISRYKPNFDLARYFVGKSVDAPVRHPVLIVLLPLKTSTSTSPLGFIEYYIDAQKLSDEIKLVDQSFNRETFATLAIGTALVAAVLTTFYFGLRRAQSLIAERNERLIRANFELTLAAKASAVGQITSHLIHGLQGPVAGLRAVVSGRTSEGGAASDWKSASDYTERLQGMIQETVALLGDTGAQVSYELSCKDLVETIRRRNSGAAADKGVALEVTGEFETSLDSHRGGLVCLIATNLVQNAIASTPPGRRVDVAMRKLEGALTLFVTDQGTGIPEEIRAHLFEPGRSGRPGGTGLGLAISQLLARQIGASLTLVDTSAAGSTFRLTLPV